MLILTVACGKATNHYTELPLINAKANSLAQSISSQNAPFVLTAPVSMKANIKNSQKKMFEVELLSNELDDLKENYRSYMNNLFNEQIDSEFFMLSRSIVLGQITDELFYNFKSQHGSITQSGSA